MLISNGPLTASIATETGNQVQSLKANGHEILWMPNEPNKLGGIPLLAPWANRLDGDAYFANGKRYLVNGDITSIRRDANGLPIHGLLLFCEGWKVVKRSASSVTSRLEFWRHPEWMAQFPFAHTIEITHRIVEQAVPPASRIVGQAVPPASSYSLEVETAIENHSIEPIPLCIGFHPYFQLSDSPRDEWKLTIPARESVVLSDKLIPTGETRPFDLPHPMQLAGVSLDAVFTGLTGDAFVAEGRRQRISVRFGPKFPVAIVYAPQGQPFFCVEPMTALTNVFNLDHAGKLDGREGGLQHIAPGTTWRESFWIKPEGGF
jgi:aldose 1-epimerase